MSLIGMYLYNTIHWVWSYVKGIREEIKQDHDKLIVIEEKMNHLLNLVLALVGIIKRTRVSYRPKSLPYAPLTRHVKLLFLTRVNSRHGMTQPKLAIL